MAGPGDEIAAGPAGHGHLRASNADREQVIDVLKAAFVQGRLTRDELDLRVGQALQLRTYAEQAAVVADLPAALMTAEKPGIRPAGHGPGHRATRASGADSRAWADVAGTRFQSGSQPARPCARAAPVEDGDRKDFAWADREGRLARCAGPGDDYALHTLSMAPIPRDCGDQPRPGLARGDEMARLTHAKAIG